ncbi:DUF6479 family protein [Streptomyces sp. NPDC006529]|uniref:DUF6479 family protein n=1 Tax=Streptomyces sp. NPDC006529 TaxID=3157177 RepID=UPI0033AA7186
MIATEHLAAEGQSSLFLVLAGVVVVVLLIGAFWYGARRNARRAAPARPTEQNPVAQQREDSWQTPDGARGDGRGDGREGPRA